VDTAAAAESDVMDGWLDGATHKKVEVREMEVMEPSPVLHCPALPCPALLYTRVDESSPMCHQPCMHACESKSAQSHSY